MRTPINGDHSKGSYRLTTSKVEENYSTLLFSRLIVKMEDRTSLLTMHLQQIFGCTQ